LASLDPLSEGDFAAARRAAEASPGDGPAQIRLISALLARGQRDEARKAFERALAKLDKDAPTRQLLELKLIDTGGEPPAKPET
jgi:tetratricopeptide (TPR) repeat protein